MLGGTLACQPLTGCHQGKGGRAAQAEYERLIASALSEHEKEQLHDLLRRLMGAFSKEALEAGKRKAHTGDD